MMMGIVKLCRPPSSTFWFESLHVGAMMMKTTESEGRSVLFFEAWGHEYAIMVMKRCRQAG
jgi:hypothetical protein